MSAASPAERIRERIGFGGGTIIAAGYGAVDEDNARAAVEAGFEAGIRFFDTAHFYGSGRSEAIIGEVLDGRRDQITLCTKGGVRYADPTDLRSLQHDCSYEGLRGFLEESLERLRTDRVDVYLLHQFDPALTPEAQMENLARLRDDGLVSDVGFCNFGTEACRRALATGIPTYVEYSLSLLDRRYVSDMEAAGEAGARRIAFGTYVHGLLSEGFDEDHEFDQDDWRGRSRREGSSGTSGNVFFAGDAFARHVAVARQLSELAAQHDLSLAAFVLAVTAQDPAADITLIGCRNAREVVDGLAGFQVDIDQSVVDQVQQIVGSVDRPTVNQLGV